jgi:hypothetical protein
VKETMFVRQLESNIKGGVCVELAPKTLIVGVNGAGKSAIVNALELALSKRVSDITGRMLTREADLLSLAPNREGAVYAQALLNNGCVATWKIPDSGKGKGRARRAEHELPKGIDPETVFPLRGVQEALTGSADLARKWFLSQVASLTDDQIKAHIPKSLQTQFRVATAACKLTDHPVDKLLAALEFAKKKALGGRAEAKAAKQVAKQVGRGLPPPPSEADEEALSKELQSAEQGLQHVIEQLAAQQAQEHARNGLHELSDLHRRAAKEDMEAQEALRVHQAQMSQLEAEQKRYPIPVPLDELKMAVIKVAYASAKTRHGECPVCGESHPQDRWDRRVVAIKAALEQRNQSNQAYITLESRLVEMEQQKQALIAHSVVLTEKLQRLGEERGRLQALLTGPVSNDGMPLQDKKEALEAKLRELREKQVTMIRARAAWTSAYAAEEAGLVAKRGSSEWTDLIDACDTAIETLLDQHVSTFIQKVQTFLPVTDQFALQLHDGERGGCWFGLMRDGVLHTALSGVEWARVLAAIAMARQGDGLQVVCPEDRAFDPMTLSHVLEAFGKAQAQVIVTSPVMPENLPAGWLLVRVEQGKVIMYAPNLISVAKPKSKDKNWRQQIIP